MVFIIPVCPCNLEIAVNVGQNDDDAGHRNKTHPQDLVLENPDPQDDLRTEDQIEDEKRKQGEEESDVLDGIESYDECIQDAEEKTNEGAVVLFQILAYAQNGNGDDYKRQNVLSGAKEPENCVAVSGTARILEKRGCYREAFHKGYQG